MNTKILIASLTLSLIVLPPAQAIHELKPEYCDHDGYQDIASLAIRDEGLCVSVGFCEDSGNGGQGWEIEYNDNSVANCRDFNGCSYSCLAPYPRGTSNCPAAGYADHYGVVIQYNGGFEHPICYEVDRNGCASSDGVSINHNRDEAFCSEDPNGLLESTCYGSQTEPGSRIGYNVLGIPVLPCTPLPYVDSTHDCPPGATVELAVGLGSDQLWYFCF